MDNKIALAEIEDMIAKLQKENEKLKWELKKKLSIEDGNVKTHICELSLENKRLKQQIEHGAVSFPVIFDEGLICIAESFRKKESGDTSFLRIPSSAIRVGMAGDVNNLSSEMRDYIISYVEKELSKRLIIPVRAD